MVSVSVLIPTYNRAGYIEGAIETATSQTYEDLEVVVVDDHSTDRTPELLDQYADSDTVRVLRNDENRGIAASHNRAAAAAEGECLCILDDDDRWHPTKVEKQVRRMKHRSDDVAVVYTGGIDTKNGRPIRWYRPDLRGDIYPEVLREFGMNPHSGHMIRASSYAAVGGFDTEFPRGVDWELSIRLAQKYKYDYIKKPLVKRKIHDENVSEKEDRSDVGELIWEKHGEKIRQHPDIERVFRNNWRQRKAWRALEQGRRVETVCNLLKIFKCNPTIFHGLMVAIGCGGKSTYELAQHVKWKTTCFRYERGCGEGI
jgi:glycosyltransferase involved in cell wall biosynthesis